MLFRLGQNWEEYGFCAWRNENFTAHHQIDTISKSIMSFFKRRTNTTQSLAPVCTLTPLAQSLAAHLFCTFACRCVLDRKS